MTRTLESATARQLLRRSTWFNLLLAGQLFAGLAYAIATGDVGSRYTHFVIPFVWIAVSVWVLWQTRPAPTRPRVRVLAGGVAALYLLVLLYLSGILVSSTPSLQRLVGANDVAITWGRSLGWSPVLVYAGERIAVTLVPYQTIGLLALSYLVYDALLDLARSTIGGVIGIAACPACVGPMFAPLLAGGVGGSSLVLLLGMYGYEIATVLFVVAVGILYHRQGVSTAYAALAVRIR